MIGTMRRLAAVSLVFLLAGCAGEKSGKQPLTSLGQTAPPPRWESRGIKVERIMVAAGGNFLDMRYRVTDPAKAGELLKKNARLELTDQTSGTVLTVPTMPKVGKLRQLPAGDRKDDRIYWVFFNNPGGLVKPGGRVTLTIGEARISDIAVE